MLITDLFARMSGVRIARESTLQAAGFHVWRDATRELNGKAEKVIAAMATLNGRALTPALRRRCDEYAIEILGSAEYAPWLHVYSAMRGEFHEGWMPENYYHMMVVPRIAKGLSDLSTKKSLSNLLLRTDALPDIAYHIDGVFYDRAYRIISRAAMVELARPHGAVFVKGDGGGRGSNIRKVPVGDLTDTVFGGDCAIQRPIRQHAFFDEFMAGAVATLRINTLKTPSGAIDIRGAAIRFARSGIEWLISDKNVAAVVTDGAGTLDQWGYTSDWRAWAKHPDSGTAFAGRRIPSFAEAVEFCRSLHAGLPQFTIVGWDVAINREGAVELVEWNVGHCGITFTEAVTGPHFRDMGWERFARKPAA